MPRDHARGSQAPPLAEPDTVQVALLSSRPWAAVRELNVCTGGSVAAVRALVSEAVRCGALLGFSSSLLGTLAPELMPGGFGPLGADQPDLLLWCQADSIGEAESICDQVLLPAAADLVLARATGGSLHEPDPPHPVPVIADGPCCGGTYLLFTSGPVREGGRSVEPVAGSSGGDGARHLILSGALGAFDLDAIDPGSLDGHGLRDFAGGLYLAPSLRDCVAMGRVVP